MVEVQPAERVAACRADAEVAKCIHNGRYSLLTFSHPVVTGASATIHADVFGVTVRAEGAPDLLRLGRVYSGSGWYQLTLERVGTSWRVVSHTQNAGG
jgi:hypothetical protein